MDYRTESPEILREFLSYHETIKGHSSKTIDEYYLDLRNFFRYIKIIKNIVPAAIEPEDVSIMDVDINLIKTITVSDIYDYMSYLSRDRIVNQSSTEPKYGVSAATRARKIASIRSFYNYLYKTNLLEENPMQDLEPPKIKKTLPKFLTLEESVNLLKSIKGPNQERDYCIITLFLNCGLRISELVGLNLSDVRQDHIRVLGKGNKERIVYLNDACKSAIDEYLTVRSSKETNALFLNRYKKRISSSAVHKMVKKHLLAANIDSTQYSSHKLRHTAATLMLQNGVDVRTLQEILGHEHLNTTEIYTHVDSANLRIAAQANPLSKIKNKEFEDE